MKKRILMFGLAVVLTFASAGQTCADGIDKDLKEITLEEAEQLLSEGKLSAEGEQALQSIREYLANGTDVRISYYEKTGTLFIGPKFRELTEEELAQRAAEEAAEEARQKKVQKFLDTVPSIRDTFNVIGKAEDEWDARVSVETKTRTYKVTMDWGTVDNIWYEETVESILALDNLANSLLPQVSGTTSKEKLDSVTKLVADFYDYDNGYYLRYHAIPYKILMHRGVCQDYMELEAVMLCKLGYDVKGIVGYDGIGHTWLAVDIDGTWLDVDPTLYDDLGYSRYLGETTRRTENCDEYDFRTANILNRDFTLLEKDK